MFFLITPSIAFADQTEWKSPQNIGSFLQEPNLWYDADYAKSEDGVDAYSGNHLAYLKTSWKFSELSVNAVVDYISFRIKERTQSSGINSLSAKEVSYENCSGSGFASILVIPSFRNTSLQWIEKNQDINKGWLNADSLRTGNYCFLISNGYWPIWVDAVQMKVNYHLSPEITITPIPSLTPNIEQEAFLDIPFDYIGAGKTFEQVAFNPESWFDHEYPFADVLCTNLYCPLDIIRFDSQSKNRTLDAYKHHNGYDYSGRNGAILDVPVLAAASGSAEYIRESESGGYGNLVKITHKEGYQTWYGHLQPQRDPISGEVKKGDKIGLVGTSGNSSGPHIHFTVLKDINGNKNFDDDRPYGFVDPLGWEGNYIDPWTEYKSGNSSGSASIKLFTNLSKSTERAVPKAGGEVSRENLNLKISPDTLPLDFTIKIKDGAFEHIILADKKLSSIIPSFFLEAFNSLGDKITQFLKPIVITYDYSSADLSNTKEDTLKMYYYDIQEQKWIPVDSVVDLDTKIIIAETAHFTQFAVMGEPKDTENPLTQADLSGNKGEANWYSSDVEMKLIGKDNVGGLGLLYVLYSFNDNLWEKYIDKLEFNNEGDYKIYYQSFDKAGNSEDRKSVSFRIDKILPNTSASASGTKGDGGWFTSDVSVALTAIDSASGVAKTEYSSDDGKTYLNYEDEIAVGKEGISELLYRSVDKAGNVENGKKLIIKIDKTPPSSVVYKAGLRGVDNWYRSDVEIGINGNDDISGYQTSYYSLDDGENYTEVTDVIMLEDEGEHKIYYYSVDKAGNEEERKSFTVKIDKTAPIITINAAPNSLWPANGKMVDVRIIGNVNENNLLDTMFRIEDEYSLVDPTLSSFNQVVRLEAKRNGNDLDGRLYLIKAVAEDMAGNSSNASAKVVVPHDQGI